MSGARSQEEQQSKAKALQENFEALLTGIPGLSSRLRYRYRACAHAAAAHAAAAHAAAATRCSG